MSAPEALSALFHDYLYAYARVAEFYPAGAPFDWDRLVARAKALPYPAPRRAAIAEELRRQNPDQEEAAARFAAPGTVAVVTGQQVGLFGGPLLGVHKAMSAVRVAERLREQGIAAVPIFWMASQDHDLAEINQAWLNGADGSPQRLQASFGEGAAGQPAGAVRLEASVTPLLEDAARVCPGDWNAVRAAYRPGATLAEAFAALLGAWFAPWGLLVFDPRLAAAAHALWQPYYLAAFDRQPELAQRLAGRAAALAAAGYHVQVEQTGAASMLFLEEPAGRLGVRHLEDGTWRAGETVIAADVLRQRIAAAPGRVSPGALLRPVLQDVAFPTVAHVVGPAETAYLAQSGVLYAALGAAQPIAWPRARLTLLDAKAQRLLQKYQLSVDDLRAHSAAELLARQALPAGIEKRSEAMRAALSRGMAELRQELEQLDPTLLDAATGAAQKIEHQLAQLETRVGRSLARRSGEIEAQARHLDGTLFPNREPQERVLAAAGWRARDPQLLQKLHAGMDPAQPAHQVLTL